MVGNDNILELENEDSSHFLQEIVKVEALVMVYAEFSIVKVVGDGQKVVNILRGATGSFVLLKRDSEALFEEAYND